MRPTVALRLEHLEDRSVPATFGTPWPNGSNITLSFAPDGTDIQGSSSNLSTLILSGPSGSTAQLDILRAFQTWVANANVNIGLVGDSGAAWDAPGEVQGDTRFGDIRVGGRSWASDVLALTTAFNYFNTQSGNVAINTGASLSYGTTLGTYDLYTVMLQEAGHTLGVGNSNDITSVMYEYYQGLRSGLSAGDIASIQALYGTRQQDALEGTGGNDTLATATTYSGTLTADLTTTADVDYFRFTVGTNGVAPVIRLQSAGLSLVQARVQVLDALGTVVAEGYAQNSTDNNITLAASNLLPSGTYYVRVSSNQTDVFGVGSYQLTVDGTSVGTDNSDGISTTTVSGDHGTFATAADLTQTVSSVSDELDYNAQVTPDTLTNVGYLRVHAPAAAPDQVVNLVVSVTNQSTLQDLQVNVYDVNQNQLTARVMSDITGAKVIQVDNVLPNVDYFVSVVSSATYDVTIDFTTRDTAITLGSTGAPSATTTHTATLSVAQSQVVQFVLSALGSSDASVCMTIRDAFGNTVFVLTAAGGTSRSSNIFLKAGIYQVQMTQVASPLYTGGALSYTLHGWGVTDPIGAVPVDPTGTPVGSPPPGGIPPPVNGQTLYWTATSPGDGSLWF